MEFAGLWSSFVHRRASNRITFNISFCCYLSFFAIIKTCCGDQDTLSEREPLADGQAMNSTNGTFRLQFFSPDNSTNRYLGIFTNRRSARSFGASDAYNDRAVWVANRDKPLPDEYGSIMIDADGLLKIFYTGGTLIVSRTVTTAAYNRKGNNRVVSLLDDGNFLLTQLNSDGSTNRTLWQSFDYPTDTLLPGMKLGVDLKTGHKWSLTSWMSDQAPASGSFTLGTDPNGTSELIAFWQGSVYWTSGLWQNGRFDNMSRLRFYNFSYISKDNEKYFTYSVNYNMSGVHLTMNHDGNIVGVDGIVDDCDKPQAIGCVREELPPCRTRRGNFSFIRRDGYRFHGESYRFSTNSNLSLFDCQAKCLGNCSCVAFGSINQNETGCEIWNTLSRMELDLADNRVLFALEQGTARRTNRWIWLVTGIIGVAILLSAISFYLIKRRKVKVKGKIKEMGKMLKRVLRSRSKGPKTLTAQLDEKMNDEVRRFSLDSIKIATNYFSNANKLGEGGFGPVYKVNLQVMSYIMLNKNCLSRVISNFQGQLPCGQEIAVKRLSKNSGQGLVEFKNEILLIAKLQHTNLVRLLGCCIQGQEKILVYEYMPNKSLDHFLFDSSIREALSWTTRTKIAEGIAQGLLYLHQYSRLKVIHRDLKAGNILLDPNMNAKISDFGMARMFEAQQSQTNTKKIVGTHGYMSPEYIINGVVSTKTDVFSFGVLLLEIISGKRNRASYDDVRPLNLIGLAWELWIDGRAMELIDPALDDISTQKIEVMRYINVGLLCVQDNSTDRPSIMNVVLMLKNEYLELPTPKRPAFFLDTSQPQEGNELPLEKPCTNGLSISSMEAR